MVALGYKYGGYYPDVKIVTLKNGITNSISDRSFSISNSDDVYIYIDFSSLTEHEILNELYLYITVSNDNNPMGSIRVKSIADYDHEKENQYSSLDKGDIDNNYISSLFVKNSLQINITSMALKKLKNNDKKIKFRFKYYGDGIINISNPYQILTGNVLTKQDLISSIQLGSETILVVNNSKNTFSIVKRYQFEYSRIVLQSNIVFSYNRDQSRKDDIAFVYKFELVSIGENKYMYIDDMGTKYIYYLSLENSNEYICLDNNSKFTIDDDKLMIKINNCDYEVDKNNHNIKSICRGSKCLEFEYDNNQKLVAIYKGSKTGTISTGLTNFITINDTEIICSDQKVKFKIERTNDLITKIEQYDIDVMNNVFSKNYSLQINYLYDSINNIVISECENYDFNCDEEGNLLVTNLVNELSYNFGINSGYYYISDNYNNIEKYYYNTKNEVIYYVKEKNGKIFEKKCVGYRNYQIKEQINLFANNLLKDINFNGFIKNYEDESNYGLIDNVCTNPNMYTGLCDQEYIFYENTTNIERSITKSTSIKGSANDIITLAILSKVELEEINEYLKVELDVGYITKDGIVPKKYVLNCKCKDNDYEFNAIKFLVEKNFDSIDITIKYKGDNKCRISNVMIYKEKNNNKVVYDNNYRVVGVSQYDTTLNTNYEGLSNSQIESIKDNDGKYIIYEYNSNDQIVLEKSLINNDYVEYEYTDDNLLISKNVKNDIYESEETYEYDELQNIVEETVDEKSNYYFNKIEQDKTIVQCIDHTGLLNKQEEVVNGLLDIKSTKVFQLNDCYEKNKFYYENGVLKQIDTFDDKIYTFTYDSKKRIKNIYIDNKLYIEYTYSQNSLDNIEEKKYQNDNIIKFNYDTYGRLVEVYKKTLSTTPTKLASYEYDSLNRISLIKNESNQNESKYEYDELGNIIKIETPTHISTYVYNDDKELVDTRIQEKSVSKIYNSSTVSNALTIGSVFKLLSKNIYCDYYYPNERQETYGGKKLIDNLSDLINGEKNISYDESLKRNIMLCNEDVQFNNIYFNDYVKKNQTIYNGKVFNKDDYDYFINKKQGILGVFKFENRMLLPEVLFYFSPKQIQNSYQLLLIVMPENNNIILRKIIYHDNDEVETVDFETNFYIDNKKWNIIGLINDIDNNKLGVIFNDKIHWFDNTNIVYYTAQINQSRIINSQIDLVIYKIAYLMYGYLDINAKELERLYIDFNTVFNGNKIDITVSNTYDVFDTQNLNKIPLNNSFKSYNGVEPWVIHANNNFLNNSGKYFKYDSELNKYCYEASSYNESYLSYFIGDNLNNLLISAQVKLLNKDFNTENTIYCVKGNSEKVKITYKYPNINVYVNGTFKQSFNVDFKLDKFNYVKTYISNGVMTLTVNEETKIIEDISINTSQSNYTLIIGNDDYNNCFEGLISDVIYGNPLENIDTNILPTQFISKSDTQGRLRNKIIKTNNNSIQTTYSYYDKVKHNNVKTLNHLINRVKNHDGSEEIISYDENDSIIKRVLIKNDLVVRINNYKYDSFNRLIEEVRYEVDNNSNVLSETYKGVYEYDNYGNIIRNKTYKNSSLIKNIKLNYQRDSPHTLMSYVNEYNNSKYNIQYGNSTYPTKIGNNSITYEGSKIVKYGNNTYKYNTVGKRIQKITENNKEYNYYYDNNNLIKQTCDNIAIDYIYNNSLLEGLRYNNEEFYYIRDITGCIEKIIDKDNNVMVLYKYTSYGEVEGIVNNQLNDYRIQIANILKEYNGFVYKGYYYDVETGLFYCNSRYYSPELCRWISPDDIEYLDPESVNGLNLYCYCLNNPVMYSDGSGHMPEWLGNLLIAGAGVLLIAGLAIATIATGGATAGVAGAFFAGALKGALIGAAIGTVAGGAIGYAVDGVDGMWTGMAIGFTGGAVIGAVIGGSIGYSTTKIHSVYISKTDDVVTYVGRTNNISRRTTEHALANRGIVPQEVANKLTLKQARGLEQALINKYGMIKNGGTLLNKINSISINNPIYQKAVSWGVKYISKIAYLL